MIRTRDVIDEHIKRERRGHNKREAKKVATNQSFQLLSHTCFRAPRAIYTLSRDICNFEPKHFCLCNIVGNIMIHSAPTKKLATPLIPVP